MRVRPILAGVLLVLGVGLFRVADGAWLTLACLSLAGFVIVLYSDDR